MCVYVKKKKLPSDSTELMVGHHTMQAASHSNDSVIYSFHYPAHARLVYSQQITESMVSHTVSACFPRNTIAALGHYYISLNCGAV